jgi:2-methylcitrate dehydratase PrpD
MNVSDRLAAHVAGARWEELPADARQAARRVLLDATGVIYAASGLAPEAQPFIALAAGQPGPCRVLGTGVASTPQGAALANGALAHAVDFEDAFDRAPGHPNASLVPALLALAQAEGPVDGKRLLTAIAVGGDLACRMALALKRPMEDGGWYPPPIVAAYGAAAGAASLLGLDARQVRDALSLTLCQATMPGEIKHSRGTVLRAVREAFPAHAAVTSALLARAGTPGFEQPLEGPAGFYALYAGGSFDEGALFDGLGERFWGTELTFKPWPSCRGTHPFIEIALSLAGGPAVEQVTVSIDPVQRMLVDPPARKRAPATVIDAKFSIPFCVALALVRGKVTLAEFGANTLADPAILASASKVTVDMVEHPAWTLGSGGALRARLADGSEVSREVTTARGAPARPLADADLIAKFIDCCGFADQPPADPRGLAEAIMSIDEIADAGALFA